MTSNQMQERAAHLFDAAAKEKNPDRAADLIAEADALMDMLEFTEEDDMEDFDDTILDYDDYDYEYDEDFIEDEAA